MRFIPYLGNKRKLIPNILEAIGDAEKVLDLFSGSGVVAYHLRSSGKTVHANDIAPYSYHINQTYLKMNSQDITVDFDKINSLTEPANEAYISKHYSEGSPRLYFTRENGLFIDAVAEYVWSQNDIQARHIILCELIYKMTVHSNTSGIFKSFHKTFAGGERTTGIHGFVFRSNRKRITSKITLEPPMPAAGIKGEAFQYEASEFFDKVDDCYDAIYLDPPYNIHQYSGNYHLLEQICRPFADRYIPNSDQVSGIDPSLFKSDYCYKTKVRRKFDLLLDKIKNRTKRVVISYNSKGYLSQQEIHDLCRSKFKSVADIDIAYCNYRGGIKQSEKSVKEFLFVCVV